MRNCIDIQYVIKLWPENLVCPCSKSMKDIENKYCCLHKNKFKLCSFKKVQLSTWTVQNIVQLKSSKTNKIMYLIDMREASQSF